MLQYSIHIHKMIEMSRPEIDICSSKILVVSARPSVPASYSVLVDACQKVVGI